MIAVMSRREFLKKLMLVAVFSNVSLLFAGMKTAVASNISDLRITDKSGFSIVLSETDFLKLPQTVIRTQTVWTEGLHQFAGVTLKDVLLNAGIDLRSYNRSTLLRLIAWNDYTIDIPLSDAIEYKALIAAFMDGKRLTIQDKGPYWLVYPRDSYSRLQDARFDPRWSWQLKEIAVQ